MSSEIQKILSTIEVSLAHLEDLEFDDLDVRVLMLLENRLSHIGRRSIQLSTLAHYREVRTDKGIEYQPRYKVSGGLGSGSERISLT